MTICCLATLSARPVRAGDWHTGVGGNSARNSLSDESGPTDPDILWTGSRPAIVAQQGCSDGNLFVTSRIGSFTIPTGTWIVAQDLTTGNEVWAVQLPFDFPATSWRSRASAIRDGHVYATRAGNTNLDFLYALAAADGSIVWQSEDLIDEGTTESVAFAANGDIIAGSFNSLIRIDGLDGTTVWQSPRSCPTSSGCQAAAFGNRVYIWEASGAGPVISVFDIKSGAELYSSAGIGGGFIEQLGPFVGPDGTVYAPRTQNNALTDFLVAFDDTGAALVERWSVPLGYVPFASFGIGPDGSVYSYATDQDGGNADLTIQRLHPANGNVIDTSPILPSNFPVQPRIAIDATGTIYLTNGGFSNGGLFSLNADLSLRWSEAIPNVNVGGPVLGQDGILIVCGIGNNVRAYQTAVAPADMNCDGNIDGLDVQAYLLAVLDPVQYEVDFPDCNVNNGDLNSDGHVDSGDNAAFAQCLVNGVCP
ncbi:MAG: PQQ-binding-like beta-propeller repeat protein [Planctomycetota bacterium]|nr:PQQ-binding-like beta-propeller repeat protein [Planctomycetota bacterium]